MSKAGKISPIKKDAGSELTMENGLRKKGFSRVPGTGVFITPYKEGNGRYRTGLDPEAGYIKRIQDEVERDLEVERVTALKSRLEKELGVDLSPTSLFWNYSKSKGDNDNQHVHAVKLQDKDQFYDFTNPLQELTFSWLRVHPRIAPSYRAWERGEVDSEVQFYVVDDEVESKILFNKKQLINRAIIKFDSMSPTKRKQIARLLGISVTEDDKEEIVYNLVDNLLKETEFKKGQYKGLEPVKIFDRLANMKEDLAHVKDIIKQAIANSIYREKNGGKLYEGEFEVAPSEDELVKRLIDEEYQDELLSLEEKLKFKKLASV